MYDKKQMAQLKAYEYHFHCVCDAQFKRATGRREDEELLKIYNAATKGKMEVNFSCPRCVYDLYQKAGELYFKTLAKEEEKKKTANVLKTIKNKEKEKNTRTKK